MINSRIRSQMSLCGIAGVPCAADSADGVEASADDIVRSLFLVSGDRGGVRSIEI